MAILTCVWWYFIVVLICISLIMSNVECFFHVFVGHLYVFFGEISLPSIKWAFLFFQIYIQQRTCWVIWQFFFFEIPLYYFPQWLHQFTFPPTVYVGSLFATSLSTFAISVLLNSHPDSCEVISCCGLDLHFPNNKWYWAYFHVPLAIHISSLEKCLFRSSVHFPIVFFFFWCWVAWAVYITWILISYHLQIFSIIQ